MRPRIAQLMLAMAPVALALVACGGGPEAAVPDPLAALFGADGRPSAAARHRPEGVPATRSGLYATPAQYDWEELTVGSHTVLVAIDPSNPPATALARALADRAWATDHRGVAHFVVGGSCAQAAAVADGLSMAGVDPVFLVHGGTGPAC